MIERVLVSLADPGKEEALRSALLSPDRVVDLLRGKSRIRDRLAGQICDLLVISRDRITKPLSETVTALALLPDAPAVVVVGSWPDVDERAELLAVGAKAVLDADTSVVGLVDVVVALLAERRVFDQLRSARGALTNPRLSDFVSRSPTMTAFMGVVRRIVQSHVSLLILGETGVGKERLARAIHAEGPHASGPFVAVNCGALPESLLESELFGHEEGAFTGATRSHRGCFEQAHGGTVFLDEIGEVPLHLQVKLLRILQDREVRRLGGERTFRVDVRIMAATNRELEEEVAAKRFRQDLYYRLSVMTLTVPPLRERVEDIAELVSSYIAHLGPGLGVDVSGISELALDALRAYSWPGNIRELINVVERAMLLAQGSQITDADLPASIVGSRVGASAPRPHPAEVGPGIAALWLGRPWREIRAEVVAQAERAYLDALLRDTGGRVGETARRAGMEPRSLYGKMRQHGLRKEAYRSWHEP